MLLQRLQTPAVRVIRCRYLPGSFWKCDPPVLVVMVKASAKVVGATPRIGLCNLSLSGDSVLLPPDIPNPTRNTTSKPNIVIVE